MLRVGVAKNRKIIGLLALSLLALLAFTAAVPAFADSGVPNPSTLPDPPGAPAEPWTQCPPVGYDTGCAILIVINPTGTVSTYASAQTCSSATSIVPCPYDGIEDTLVGVQDNCLAANCPSISSMTLSGSSIFGFDGDGACSGSLNNVGFPPVFPPTSNCIGGAYTSSDPQDYETTTATFSGINTLTLSSGTVDFTTPLTTGGSAWFSLEEPLSASSLTACVGSACSSSVPQFSMPAIFVAAISMLFLALYVKFKKPIVHIVPATRQVQ